MKIVTIVGARPQFIKAAAVSREITNTIGLKEVIVHTGQHFDFNMSDVFFEEMGIPKPHYNLNIHGLSHGAMTGQMLEKIENVLIGEKPDYVLVYGDTNSTLAGALAAVKLHIPVAHVEAGLRSFNFMMPEEINRILTDRISYFLFCPTDRSIKNLQEEGFDNFKCKIIKSGDVMQDAAMYYSKHSSYKSKIISELQLDDFCLCTLHREENTGSKEKLIEIFEALTEISKEIKIILPLHPRTREIVKRLSIDITCLNVINPIGYFDVIELLKKCKMVFTDSGGLQKEAFFFSKPCVTLREETEWVELIESGCNFLAGCSKKTILDGYKQMRTKKIIYDTDLYGGGMASSKIVKELLY